jgi:hypothetical protein
MREPDLMLISVELSVARVGRQRTPVDAREPPTDHFELPVASEAAWFPAIRGDPAGNKIRQDAPATL